MGSQKYRFDLLIPHSRLPLHNFHQISNQSFYAEITIFGGFLRIMIYLILTLSAGICAGFIFRRSRFLRHTGTAVSAVICLMLFFMGVKIGADENILKNLSGLGLQALLFAIAGIAGSVLAAALLYKTVFKADNDRGGKTGK